MVRANVYIIIFLVCIFLKGQVAAKDIQQQSREQEIAVKLSQIADADEIIKLKASGSEFIGLYKSGSTGVVNENNGVVILVHGMGAHPDWPDVISPLRTRLAGSGWSTFSLQMPILSPEESVAGYGKTLNIANSRIKAAVAYLDAWEMKPIILLGYSFGAVQSARYLASDQPENIAAFVSVSMLSQKFIKPKLDVYKYISRINIPILDIFGEDDLEDVKRGIDDRRLSARKNSNDSFYQIELQQAGHLYLGAEKALAEQIYVWLQQFTSIIVETSEFSEISTEILYERQ